MNAEKKLSRASMLRLQLYLEALDQFQLEGRVQATSGDIGAATGVDPVKVRQDLFGLGSAGKPMVGYSVPHLLDLLRQVFDLGRRKAACIIGFGNLGRALARSGIWSRAGYALTAIFDNDPEVVGTEAEGLRVRSIAELFGVVKAERIEMAVLTVPASAAQETAEMLTAAGVRAIWNFAPVNLGLPESVIVENQSLARGLIVLSQRSRTQPEEFQSSDTRGDQS